MALTFSRRRALALSGVAAAHAVVRHPARAGEAAIPPAPVARRGNATDRYFGETLADPYRWMENAGDPDWLPFLRAENAHARAVLDRIPGRAALLDRIAKLSGDAAATVRMQRAGGRLFFQQRPVGADNFKLLVREIGVREAGVPEEGRDRVLIDPTKLGTGSGHVSLDWWRASPDGRLVVYGLSPNGSEDSVLHILRVSDGADLPARITNTENASPSWLADSSGFFYNRLTAAVATPERYLNSEARFHRIGTDPGADPILMQHGYTADVVYDRIQMPVIVATPGTRWAALVLNDVRPEGRIFVAPVADVLTGHASWTPVADFADEVTDFAIVGEDIYLLANRDAPRGHILKTSAAAPDLAHAREIVKQGPSVIQDLDAAQDGLYLTIMDGGVLRLRRVRHDVEEFEIPLPFDGTIAALAASRDEDGVIFVYTGWLVPSDVWRVGQDGIALATGITPRPPIDVSPYETKRLFATAKDGTKIPYSILYRRGLKQDGTAPAFISAYGSYGVSPYTPGFGARSLALLDAGAIIGYANVRGGGEYGRAWHKAGQLENKPNTWRDLIAVCEDLCAQKYTAPAHLAIGGRSAGGITVGRAMTERPDLFAAVIDGVGWSNPLRYVVEQDGYGEEPEWGKITEPAGYHALKQIDSYHAVRDSVAYPAVLLTTGLTDPRVAPFHVGKMTARLQAATISSKPVLLRVDLDAGHGIGSTRAQQDRETADTYAFILWQTGVAAYQPKSQG